MKFKPIHLRTRIALATIGLMLVGGSWFFTPGIWGAARARVDLMIGKPEMKIYGLGFSWSVPYWNILENRYGIHSEVVSGCISTQRQSKYWQGYNRTIRAYFNKKYGRDIFQECNKEAHDHWPAFLKNTEPAT